MSAVEMRAKENGIWQDGRLVAAVNVFGDEGLAVGLERSRVLAQQFAASSDLLAVAKKIVNNWGDLHHKDLMQLRAAITKAEGQL